MIKSSSQASLVSLAKESSCNRSEVLQLQRTDMLAPLCTPSPVNHATMPVGPRSLVITGEDGRPLLTFHPDGRVQADLAACDEAARRFVECLVPTWAAAMEHKHGFRP